MSLNTKNILVILPTSRDYKAIAQLSDCPYNVFYAKSENYIHLTANTDFNLKQYLNICREMIESHDINGLVFSHDFSSLIAAVLCQEYGFIGPSVDSVFQAHHKFFSRKLEKNPIKSIAINIWDVNIDVDKFNYPVYVKPTLMVFTKFQHIVKTPQQMLGVIKQAQNIIPKWSKMFYEFIVNYLDLDNYPQAIEDLLLIEEVVSMPQYCVEGFTINNKNYIWAVSDSIYKANGKLTLDYYSTPSRLGSERQDYLKQQSIELANKHGLNNTFWNVELWYDGQQARITEINPRACSVWFSLYKGAYNIELYRAMMDLSTAEPNFHNKLNLISNKNTEQDLNQNLEQYVNNNHFYCTNTYEDKYGLQFHCVTFDEGLAQDIINFSLFKDIGVHNSINFEWLINPGQIVTQTESSGCVVARFELFNKDHNQAICDASIIRSNLLKKHTEDILHEYC